MASTTTILEHSQIAPFPGSKAKMSLSLTFFDMRWINFLASERLLFYDFPCSNSHFINTIIPDIKHSLSVALKHFLPLAGNLILPLHDDGHNMPQILYINGDTVSLTFAESTHDFSYLTAANCSRKSDHQFYSLLPELPSPVMKSDCKIVPLMAVRVTLFPNIGICIGFVNHHVAADARTFVGFMSGWASIHKHGGGDEHLLAGNFLPFYDRSVVKDPNGLGKLLWNQVKNIRVEESQHINLQTDKVRATYVVTKDQIQILKDRVLGKWKKLTYVSSFVVTCAYVWTCLVRSRNGEKVVRDDDDEYFACIADGRERLDPPLPGKYFGNCIIPCFARMSHEKLTGSEGFLEAAESIRVAIHELVNNEGGIMTGCYEKILSQVNNNLRGKSMVWVAGSPKFDVYDADYGWGKPKRYEVVSIDPEDGTMSLYKSRECEGGLEVGLSLPKTSMDAFATLFVHGFNIMERS